MAVTSVLPFIIRTGKDLSIVFGNTTSTRAGSSGLISPETNLQPVVHGISSIKTSPDSPSTGKSTGRGFSVNGFLKKVANVLEQNVFAIISGGQSSESPHYYEPFLKQVDLKDQEVLEQVLRDLVNETANRVPPLTEAELQAFITKSVALFSELRLFPKYYIKGQHIKAGGKEGEEVSPWTQLQGLIGTYMNLPVGVVQMLKTNIAVNQENLKNALESLKETVILIKIAKKYHEPLNKNNQKWVNYLLNAKNDAEKLIQIAAVEGRVLSEGEQRWANFVSRIPLLNQENEESTQVDK